MFSETAFSELLQLPFSLSASSHQETYSTDNVHQHVHANKSSNKVMEYCIVCPRNVDSHLVQLLFNGKQPICLDSQLRQTLHFHHCYFHGIRFCWIHVKKTNKQKTGADHGSFVSWLLTTLLGTPGVESTILYTIIFFGDFFQEGNVFG